MSATALTTAIPALLADLTADDRCDRCGSQAYVYVRLGSGGELLFCGHHARRYDAELRKIAEVVNDQTSRLLSC